jgi:hypothetical protein
MKKLPLLIALVFFASLAFGQNVDADRVNVRTNFTLPVTDTTAAALKIGEERIRPQDSSLYRWNGLRWRKAADIAPNLQDVLVNGNVSSLPMSINGLRLTNFQGSLQALYVLSDGTVTTNAASIIHGTKGYALYFAPDGSGYTFPLKWDSIGNQFTMERVINFPAGFITTKNFDMSSTVDNSKATGYTVSGTSTNSFGVNSVTVSTPQALYDLLNNTYTGGPDATHKNGSSGFITQSSQDSADAFIAFHRLRSGYRIGMIEGITSTFGRKDEWSLVFQNSQTYSNMYNGKQLMGMDTAGRWRAPAYKTAQVDSVNQKPLVMDINGNISRSDGWAPGTGGTGISLTSLAADAPLFYNNSTGHFRADTTNATLTSLATQADLLKYINKVSDTSTWHTLNYNDGRYLPLYTKWQIVYAGSNGVPTTSYSNRFNKLGTTIFGDSILIGGPSANTFPNGNGGFDSVQNLTIIGQLNTVSQSINATTLKTQNQYQYSTIIGLQNSLLKMATSNSVNQLNFIVGDLNVGGKLNSTIPLNQNTVFGLGNLIEGGQYNFIAGGSNQALLNGAPVAGPGAISLIGFGLKYNGPELGGNFFGYFNDFSRTNVLAYGIGNGTSDGSRSDLYDLDRSGNQFVTPGNTAARPTGSIRAGTYRINSDSLYRWEIYDGSAWHASGTGTGGSFTSPLTINNQVYSRTGGVDAAIAAPGHDGMHFVSRGGTLGWADTTASVAGNLYTIDGTLLGNRQVLGAGGTFSLQLGTAASRLSRLDLYTATQIGLHGMVMFDNEPTVADANYTAQPNQSTFNLPTISANRVFAPPTTVNGGIILVQVSNTNTTFSWQPLTTNFKNPDGVTTITNFQNAATYIFKNNGTNWIQYSGPYDTTLLVTQNQWRLQHDTINTKHQAVGIWGFYTNATYDTLIDKNLFDSPGLHWVTNSDSTRSVIADTATFFLSKAHYAAHFDDLWPTARIAFGSSGKLTSSINLTFDGTNVAFNGAYIGQGISPGGNSLYAGTNGNTPSAAILNNTTIIGMGSANTTMLSNSATGLGAFVLNHVDATNTAINLTAIGDFSLFNNTSGRNNTGVGHGTLNQNTTGFNNTVLGAQVAGFSLGTTSQNTILVGIDSMTNNVVYQNALGIGNNFTGLRNNVAIIGTKKQVISLGNGGMTTAAYTALGTTATSGDQYFNLDSASYIEYTGSIWIRMQSGGVGGSGSSLTQFQIGVGSTGNTLSGQTNALMNANGFTSHSVSSNNVFTAGFSGNISTYVWGTLNVIKDNSIGAFIYGSGDSLFHNTTSSVNNAFFGTAHRISVVGIFGAVNNNLISGNANTLEEGSGNAISGYSNDIESANYGLFAGQNNYINSTNSNLPSGNSLIGVGLKYTSSSSLSRHFFGNWNIDMPTTMAVGNGTSSGARSNLWDLDSVGNEFLTPTTTANRPTSTFLRAGSWRISSDSNYRMEVYTGTKWLATNQAGGGQQNLQFNYQGYLAGSTNFAVNFLHGTLLGKHVYSNSPTPTVVTPQQLHVTSVTIVGTDIGFTVTVVTNAAVSGKIAQINYGSAYIAQPHGVMTVRDPTTAAAIAATSGGYAVFSPNDSAPSNCSISAVISAAGTYNFEIITVGD